MYTIQIINKDTNETVLCRKCAGEYTYSEGSLKELKIATRYSRIYTTIRDNEILVITKEG